jgi:hypothetical protein
VRPCSRHPLPEKAEIEFTETKAKKSSWRQQLKPGGDLIIIDDPLKPDEAFSGTSSAMVPTRGGHREFAMDALFVDVIARRYEAATDNSAVLIETGETFEALAARRAREAAPF